MNKINHCTVITLLIIFSGVTQVTAAPPQTINYQGFLTNTGGTPQNGNLAMVFSIYNVASGGAALWTETHSVTVANGLYSVILGAATPTPTPINLPFDVPYFLGIAIAGDAEMTPRTVLTGVPYAFRSVTVQTDPTPAGIISAFGGAAAPAGYFLCDGSAVSRAIYAALFAVIGTSYGVGNGTTTFNLPDMRGIFPCGAGTNGTLTKANLNPMTGGAVGSLTNDKMQGFVINAAQENGARNTNTGGTLAFATNNTIAPLTDGVNGTPRIGDETAPASLSVNFIIKY